LPAAGGSTVIDSDYVVTVVDFCSIHRG
jgi:hypothetical protein